MRKLFLFLLLIGFSCSKSGTPPEFDVDPDFVRGSFFNDWTYQIYPTSNEGFTTALFSFWKPENIIPKAILVISPGSGSTSLGDVNLKEWQDYAKEEGLALMGVQISNNSSGSAASNMSLLLYALKEITTRHSIPEVKDLPFLFSGFSAGGKISYSYSLEMKPRTIAFANIKGYISDADISVSSVPGLIIVGELEGDQRVKDVKRAFHSFRSNQNVVCFAVEPNSGHSIDDSNILVRSFFSAVLKKRLVNGELVELEEANVLLSDYNSQEVYSFTDYPYDKTKAVCLIDADFATNWSDFIQ